MPGLFVKRDKERPSVIKDFLKARRTERDWKRNRWRREKGIREYQNSFEARKFYRQLGTFLALRQLVPRGIFASDLRDNRERTTKIKENP